MYIYKVRMHTSRTAERLMRTISLLQVFHFSRPNRQECIITGSTVPDCPPQLSPQ